MIDPLSVGAGAAGVYLGRRAVQGVPHLTIPGMAIGATGMYGATSRSRDTPRGFEPERFGAIAGGTFGAIKGMRIASDIIQSDMPQSISSQLTSMSTWKSMKSATTALSEVLESPTASKTAAKAFTKAFGPTIKGAALGFGIGMVVSGLGRTGKSVMSNQPDPARMGPGMGMMI